MSTMMLTLNNLSNCGPRKEARILRIRVSAMAVGQEPQAHAVQLAQDL